LQIKSPYFIGIDGGGTKCKARLEDANGVLLTEAIAGPANAARDIEGTLYSIYAACDVLLAKVSEHAISYGQIHAGIGLAGVNLPNIKQSVLSRAHPFLSLNLSTDLHIACLGAHNGNDGAIIITGTGSSGAVIAQGECLEVGGHGFIVGDKGSGAWLGKMAVSHCLEALDKLRPHCNMTEQVLKILACKTAYDLVSATINAKPSLFAQLAPMVLKLAAEQQTSAVSLVNEGAHYISQLARRLLSHAPQRLSIIGGVSTLLIPWLDSDIKATLSDAILPPEAGAIILAKTQLTQ
jgi:glucosamine kinase